MIDTASFIKGFAIVMTIGAIVTLFLALTAQGEVDRMVDHEFVAVQKELGISQCVEDRRAVCGIKFDYNMLETCEGIMNGEAVLCAKS
jgi:hypothetical protein